MSSFLAPASKDWIAVVKGWPSAIRPGYWDLDEKCCALHTKVECGFFDSRGCRGWSPGTHKSIACLYDSAVYNTVCHAMPGQLRVDNYLAMHALRADVVGELEGAGYPPKSFQRFFKGTPVAVCVYGAGYCYLQMFPKMIRSRVARILGPLPLLTDVVRLLLLVGTVRGPEYDLVEVQQDSFHVIKWRRELPGGGLVGFLKRAIELVELRGVHLRVGADELELSSPSSASSAGSVVVHGLHDLRLLLNAVYASDEEATFDAATSVVRVASGGYTDLYGTVKQYMSPRLMDRVLSAPRLVGLWRWLYNVGIDLSAVDKFDLAIATTASAVIPPELATMKVRVKMWGVHGDIVVKLFQSAYMCGNNCSAAEYSALSGRATNVNMAAVFRTSGLRDHCEVFGLAADSKANADILEAVIGIVAINCKANDIKLLLEALGLLPKVAERAGEGLLPRSCFQDRVQENMAICEPIVEVNGLNSREFKHALALRRAGLL